jgi:molybdenum cofactor cytidylyltransferase
MSEPICHILILAAGAARRMGQVKQNLQWLGKTMLQHCIDTCLLADLGPIKVVLGANHDLILPTLNQQGRFEWILNENWDAGLSSSIKKGLAHCTSADYVMMVAADQAYLEATFLQKLFADTRTANAFIGAASYEGVLGIPAVFSAASFPALMELEGDQGARKLLQAHAAEVLALPYPAAAIDLDTMEDWKRFKQR